MLVCLHIVMCRWRYRNVYVRVGSWRCRNRTDDDFQYRHVVSARRAGTWGLESLATALTYPSSKTLSFLISIRILFQLRIRFSTLLQDNCLHFRNLNQKLYSSKVLHFRSIFLSFASYIFFPLLFLLFLLLHTTFQDLVPTEVF